MLDQIGAGLLLVPLEITFDDGRHDADNMGNAPYYQGPDGNLGSGLTTQAQQRRGTGER